MEHKTNFQVVEHKGSKVLELVGFQPIKEGWIVRVLLRNKSPYPLKIDKIVLSIPYSRPITVEKKFLFWRYTKVEDKEVLAKEPAFGKVLPTDLWDWSIALTKRPLAKGRYMLEVSGRIILGKTEEGAFTIITSRGDWGVGSSGEGSLIREFKDVFIIEYR